MSQRQTIQSSFVSSWRAQFSIWNLKLIFCFSKKETTPEKLWNSSNWVINLFRNEIRSNWFLKSLFTLQCRFDYNLKKIRKTFFYFLWIWSICRISVIFKTKLIWKHFAKEKSLGKFFSKKYFDCQSWNWSNKSFCIHTSIW